MKRQRRLIGLILAALLGFVVLLGLIVHGHSIPVLQPHGQIGLQERSLILLAVGLSAFVVIPVYVMLFLFAWRYRESNHQAKYSPNWDHSRLFESIWWLVPTVIITLLSVVTWRSSHELDPYRPISSNIQPVVVQVVALQWRWLFVYPEQGIATVNYLRLPVDTPVDFQITADAPMNSFWIPQLGGQIYAMPGMATQLHLIANQTGNYNGLSANISGKGFAGMRFVANVSSAADFKSWVHAIQRRPTNLSFDNYSRLARPSENRSVSSYGHSQQGLFGDVIMQYMSHSHSSMVASDLGPQTEVSR